METIPQRLCACGCGRPAPLAQKTNTGKGHIKGQPTQYLRGHCTRRTIAQQLDDRVIKGPGCWEWQGYLMPNGYGRIQWNWKTIAAHRAAWELANDQTIPEGMVVMHTCDNRRCVRPDHLTIGTFGDNNRDTAAKQHLPIGERHHNAHASNAVVREMRRLSAEGMSYAAIGRKFSYSTTTVRKIALGLSRKFD